MPERKRQRKGFFVGGAVLAAAAAAALIVFLVIGTSDGGTVVEAKGLLSPEEFADSSGDLNSAILAMNQKEQTAAKDLTDMAANPGPPDPNAVSQKINQVSAQTWQAAETANKLSKTAQAQDGGSQNAAQMAAQYDALAQSLYSQILELENLNRLYAAGQVDLQRVVVVIADFGARTWNPGFVVEGINGNPFVPFLGAGIGGGLAAAEIPVFIGPDGIGRLGAPFGGGGPTIWIATSGDVITRTITVNVGPTQSTFDPFDATLARGLFQGDVLPDPDLVSRIVLARLDAYRFRFANQTPFVTFTSYTGFDPAGGTGVAYSEAWRTATPFAQLTDLPGVVTIQVRVARTIGIVGPGFTGAIPTFVNGRGVALWTRPQARTLVLLAMGADGQPQIVSQSQVLQTRAAVGFRFENVSARFLNATGNGVTALNNFDVSADLVWQSSVPFTVHCLGGPDLDIAAGSGRRHITFTDYAQSPENGPRIACLLLRNHRQEDIYYEVASYGGAADAAAKRDKQKSEIATILAGQRAREIADRATAQGPAGSPDGAAPLSAESQVSPPPLPPTNAPSGPAQAGPNPPPPPGSNPSPRPNPPPVPNPAPVPPPPAPAPPPPAPAPPPPAPAPPAPAASTSVTYSLSLTTDGSVYQGGQTASVCYKLSPANTAFHLRLTGSQNGAAPQLIKDVDDNGVGGGDCLQVAVGSAGGTRQFFADASVNGNTVARAQSGSLTVLATQHEQTYSFLFHGYDTVLHTNSLTAGHKYNVCLTGTINALNSNTHLTETYDPGTAFMKVAEIPVNASYCVAVTGNGSGASIHCDGSRFPGRTNWGGAFTITVQDVT